MKVHHLKVSCGHAAAFQKYIYYDMSNEPVFKKLYILCLVYVYLIILLGILLILIAQTDLLFSTQEV